MGVTGERPPADPHPQNVRKRDMAAALLIGGLLLLLFGTGPEVTAYHWQIIGGHLFLAGLAYMVGRGTRNNERQQR